MDSNISHPNRSKKLQAKQGTTYCRGCDMSLIGIGQKCPVCGYRDSKRSKKWMPEE